MALGMTRVSEKGDSVEMWFAPPDGLAGAPSGAEVEQSAAAGPGVDVGTASPAALMESRCSGATFLLKDATVSLEGVSL